MLYLVQHGKAYPESADPERRLTPEGVEETRRVGRLLRRAGVRVVEIVHSGKARARQTAEILAEYLSPSAVREAEGLSPNDDPGTWAAHLQTARDPLMIVGHLPHLARLATLLLTGKAEPPIVSFKYSGVLGLDRVEGEGGGWRIAFFITPDFAD